MVKDCNTRVMITFSAADLELLEGLSQQFNLSKSQVVHFAINGHLQCNFFDGHISLDLDSDLKKKV